ncbi:MAG: glycosyltransferase family 39 protein, partial [Planctomycetes bacterium]|nr:glycosyltransferase family 39 protein [Planctomycetota bacterium]
MNRNEHHRQASAGSDAWQRRLRAGRRAWLPPLILVAAGVLAYANSFPGDFVFDDGKHIVENERIRRIWPPGELLSCRRPVVELSLAFNYAISGLRPWSYHAFNLAVHLVAGLTLYGIVRRTLERTPLLCSAAKAAGNSPEHQIPRGLKPAARHTKTGNAPACQLPTSPTSVSARWLALVVALIWLVHPLQTQSVTYLIQRGESLMGMFYLLSLYGLIRGEGSTRTVVWYLLTVCACALGMVSKAVMVSAPLMILIYDRVFLSPTLRQALRRRWGFYVGLASTWGLLWVCGVAPAVLSASHPHATVGFSARDMSWFDYALTQPEVILHYLRLSFWPASLCLDYAWPVVESARSAIPAITILCGTIIVLML